jgi:hypothetical protein
VAGRKEAWSWKERWMLECKSDESFSIPYSTNYTGKYAGVIGGRNVKLSVLMTATLANLDG